MQGHTVSSTVKVPASEPVFQNYLSSLFLLSLSISISPLLLHLLLPLLSTLRLLTNKTTDHFCLASSVSVSVLVLSFSFLWFSFHLCSHFCAHLWPSTFVFHLFLLLHLIHSKTSTPKWSSSSFPPPSVFSSASPHLPSPPRARPATWRRSTCASPTGTTTSRAFPPMRRWCARPAPAHGRWSSACTPTLTAAPRRRFARVRKNEFFKIVLGP